jgi:hypothetical protein
MGRTSAVTSRSSEDPHLRGRTYAIPFEDVWQGALRVVRERLRGWTLDSADDQEGRIVVHVHTWWKKLNGIVEITITLDENGQTRVDAQAVTPDTARDWGANARRLRGFIKALDRASARELARRRSATPTRA